MDLLERTLRARKEASLDQRSREVRDAFHAQFRSDTGDDIAVEGPWYRETFEDWLLAEENGKLWGYPWGKDANGKITFGERYPVEYTRAAKCSGQPPTTDGHAIKMLSEDDTGAVVGGYAVLWDVQDAHNDHFTKSTWLGLKEYPTVPTLFHHGFDSKVGLSPIGKRVKAVADEVGLWVESWLDKSSKFWEQVKRLVDAGVIYYSPGSASHLVERSDDGELKSFPIIEDTLTVFPAQVNLRPLADVKAAYKAAGIDFPDDSGEGGDGEGSPCLEREQAAAEAKADHLLLELDLTEA